jgi:hypothetical protein
MPKKKQSGKASPGETKTFYRSWNIKMGAVPLGVFLWA